MGVSISRNHGKNYELREMGYVGNEDEVECIVELDEYPNEKFIVLTNKPDVRIVQAEMGAIRAVHTKCPSPLISHGLCQHGLAQVTNVCRQDYGFTPDYSKLFDYATATPEEREHELLNGSVLCIGEILYREQIDEQELATYVAEDLAATLETTVRLVLGEVQADHKQCPNPVVAQELCLTGLDEVIEKCEQEYGFTPTLSAATERAYLEAQQLAADRKCVYDIEELWNEAGEPALPQYWQSDRKPLTKEAQYGMSL